MLFQTFAIFERFIAFAGDFAMATRRNNFAVITYNRNRVSGASYYLAVLAKTVPVLHKIQTVGFTFLVQI